MTTAVLVGSTGLVGHNVLSTIISHPAFTQVHAFTRRDVRTTSPKLAPIVSSDSSQWPSQFPKLADPSQSIFISTLGTTRAKAGGLEAQRKIDHDLNIALAKAAKDAGVKTYVLLSVAGATKHSMVPYTKMKGEIEEEVIELGFEHTVLVKPGLIVGTRENDSRPIEFIARKLAEAAGMVAHGLKDSWAQDADVIAKAAVAAGLECAEGKADGHGKVWEVTAHDIIRLGRTEWKL
ncbi:hypothetical protein NA57DRAFT_78318 [Rhizodiscina lignyota]|uniref:NAD(P)-binding domain-containing protein n=1 Tax=Rhizodiscina lignyota TaxID=1504668 RepID=A0A9P4IDT9_9PEZI|nr:hypothetical protein NA57DRAFT_78318 [Rhizodiscina lignyota]